MDETIDTKYLTKSKDMDYEFDVCSSITAIHPMKKYLTIRLNNMYRRFWICYPDKFPFKVGDRVRIRYKFIVVNRCKLAWITGISDMNDYSIN